MSKKITLQSGPWHGRRIKDLGTVEIKMHIENQQTNETGIAIYLPDAKRENAHWDRNEWADKVTQ